jgi:hypothetical protein
MVAFLAPLIAFFTSAAFQTVASVAMFVASVAYKQNLAKKLAAQADRAKVLRFAFEGEPFYMQTLYGRGVIAGGKTTHRVKDSYTYAAKALTQGEVFPIQTIYDSTHYVKLIRYQWAETRMPAWTEIEIYLGEANPIYKKKVKKTADLRYRGTDGKYYSQGSRVSSTTVELHSSTLNKITEIFSVKVNNESLLSGLDFNKNLDSSQSGSKNEFLFVQQAIALGGLSAIRDITVDDASWDAKKFRHGQRIIVYPNGGVPDPMATANGIPNTNTFTDIAYSSSCFKLNRDNYQYNGSPNLNFFALGRPVRDIVKSGCRFYISGFGGKNFLTIDQAEYDNIGSQKTIVEAATVSDGSFSIQLDALSYSGSFLFAANTINNTVYRLVVEDGKVSNSEISQTRVFSVIEISSITNIDVDATGYHLYLSDYTTRKIYHYLMTVPWDLTTATLKDNITLPSGNTRRGFSLTPDGSSFYITNRTTYTVEKWSMSEAFNLSEAFNTGITLDLTGTLNGASQDLDLSTDGKQVFVYKGVSSDTRIYHWELTTPWNLSQSTYKGFYNYGTNMTSPRGFTAVFSDSNFKLSSTVSHSSNPSLILVDYLTAEAFGKGLNEDQLDLESFYSSKLICDQIVMSNVDNKGGRIWTKRPDFTDDNNNVVTGAWGTPALQFRNLPRYECNVLLEAKNSIRDNIDLIRESMYDARLVWSSGKYKLSLIHPTSQEEEDDLIKMEITSSDIVSDAISITWPDASARYNQVTIKYKDESKDFQDDIAIWPENYSDAHKQYLEEDSNIPLETELSIPSITDYYHAKNRAEQICRSSRRNMTAKIKVFKKAMILEPGDLIKLSIDQLNIANQTMMVEAVEIVDDLQVNLELRQYSWEDLAWNVSDDLAYLNPIEYNFEMPVPSNLTFTNYGANAGLYNYSPGRLDWDYVNTVAVSEFIVEAQKPSETTWLTLATTKASEFDCLGVNPGTYKFRIRSKSPMGRLSDPSTELSVVIERKAPMQLALIYANSDNQATNTQSLTYTDQKYICYYYHDGSFTSDELPIRPSTKTLSFVRFVSGDDITVTIVAKQKPGGVNWDSNFHGALIDPYTWPSANGGTVFRNNTGEVKALVVFVSQGGELLPNSLHATFSYGWEKDGAQYNPTSLGGTINSRWVPIDAANVDDIANISVTVVIPE